MVDKFIIGLMFLLSSSIIYAQKNGKFVPFENTSKKYSYMCPELQIDSIFIVNLETILFDKNDRYMNSIVSNSRRNQHFHIRFEKTDSLNYCIVVGLCDTPSKNSTGFFKHNGFYYWFSKDAPRNIVLDEKSKKRFSYIENLIGFIDPPFWYLKYNIETGNIEIIERYNSLKK